MNPKARAEGEELLKAVVQVVALTVSAFLIVGGLYALSLILFCC